MLRRETKTAWAPYPEPGTAVPVRCNFSLKGQNRLATISLEVEIWRQKKQVFTLHQWNNFRSNLTNVLKHFMLDLCRCRNWPSVCQKAFTGTFACQLFWRHLNNWFPQCFWMDILFCCVLLSLLNFHFGVLSFEPCGNFQTEFLQKISGRNLEKKFPGSGLVWTQVNIKVQLLLHIVHLHFWKSRFSVGRRHWPIRKQGNNSSFCVRIRRCVWKPLFRWEFQETVSISAVLQNSALTR